MSDNPRDTKTRIAQYIRGDGDRFQRCPACGDHAMGLTRSDELDFDSVEMYRPVTCNYCGTEWTECYTLSSISIRVEVGADGTLGGCC